jgi:hypothetical protein
MPEQVRMVPRRDLLPTPGAFGRLNNVVAIRQQSHQLPSPPDIAPWLEKLAQGGITTLIVDAGTASHMPGEAAPRGVYFRTALADIVRDAIGELAPLVHQRGMALMASVSLRDMGWIDRSLGWQDRRYVPARQAYEPSDALDVFHPAFQEYAAGVLTDLAASGVDGIVFSFEPALTSVEGFSPYAVAGFERDFKTKLTPEAWVPWPVAGVSEGRRVSTGAPPSDFWRWTGWKARERARVLGKLARAIRARTPTVVLAVEVHAESVTEPVAAAVRYSEDVLESKRNEMDAFVLRPAGEGTSASGAVRRLTDVIGEPRRIWVTVTPPPAAVRGRGDRFDAGSVRGAFEPGTGIVYGDVP